MPFVGALYKEQQRFDLARTPLLELFGEILFESEAVEWAYSDYYADEFGHPLSRKFIFFKDLITQDKLPEIKQAVMQIEDNLRESGRRTVNLDPGYITSAKVVLATRKDYAHRVCIGEGLFAEVTLMYKKAVGFVPTAFTYADYKSPENIRLFNHMREEFRKAKGGITAAF